MTYGGEMTYTRLRYHLVVATKNRRPVLDAETEEILYPSIRKISKKIGGHLFAIGGTRDHIHLLSAIPPRIAVADFIRKLKSQSSGAVKRATMGRDEFAWQVGYGGFTVDPDDIRGVYAYVTQQKRHHSDGNTWQDYEKITKDESED